tara:strand:- start:255 stop:8291 length:8037 start_codon:yes stop_codon:yes gene_type:complete
MAEFDPQAYIEANNSATSSFDPSAYIKENTSQSSASGFDPSAYIKAAESEQLTVPTMEEVPEGSTFETRSALENAKLLEAKEQDLENAKTFADENINLFFEQAKAYKDKKSSGPGGTDPFGRPLPVNLSKPIGYDKRPGSQSKVDVEYDTNVKLQETYDTELKQLKTLRDENPMFSYIKDAKKQLEYIQDPEDPTKTIKNPNKITREQVVNLAKENYVAEQKAQIFQDNVYGKVDEMVNKNIFTKLQPFIPRVGSKPLEQTEEIKKIKSEMAGLEDYQTANVNYLNSLGNTVSSINEQMRILNESFEDKSEYFKDINENSDPKKIEELRQYLVQRQDYVKNFTNLEAQRKTALDAYTDRYKTHTKEIEPKIAKDYGKLSEYLYHMDKDGHLLTGLGVSLVASGGEILNNLEQDFAEIIMLPQGLKNDQLFGDTRVAKALASWADNFEEWRDEAYKEPVTNYLAGMRNSIQEPPKFEESGDDIGSAARWAAYGVANYLPQLGALYVAGPRGLTVLAGSAAGGSFAASRMSNKLGETNYSGAQRWTHAATAFAGEYITEKFTLGLVKNAKGAYKSRVKETFKQFAKRNLAPQALLTTGYKTGGEMVSEAGAEVIGSNMADLFVFKKNVSLFEGVEEAAVTGLLMERTIAAPGLARGIMSPFTGKEYDTKLRERQTRKEEIEQELKNPQLSKEVQDDLKTEYQNLQKEQDDIIKKQHENVDMLSEQETQDLIDIDVEINRLKRAQDNVMNDNSLTESQKEKSVARIKSNEAKKIQERNDILQKVEDPAKRAKREEAYKKQRDAIKDKIEKINKKRRDQAALAEAMGGKASKAEFQEFETREEQQAFFNDLNAEQDALDKAEIADMQEMLKNPNTSRADRLTIQNNLAFLRKQIDGRAREAKSNAAGFGFIRQDADGSFKMFLNKENAIASGGNINVAAHEFLHAVLFKTTKGNQKIQDSLGQAIQDYVVLEKGGFSDGFVNKIQPYLGASNVGEEMITVMSESILDGTLEFNDGFFTKLNDIFRQQFQRLGLKSIEFNTGKDVYNFIKDYNATIEKNYDSKAIDRLLEVGAKGKLVGTVKNIKVDTTTTFSKSAFENSRVVEDLNLSNQTAEIVAKNKEIEKKILAEGIEDANGNIMASPALQRQLVTNNLPRAFALARQAANAANDLTLEEALKENDVMEWYSEYSLKLAELARTYRAQKDGKKVPFGAYMNILLPVKYSGILEKLKSKVETDRIEDETVAKKVARKKAPKDDGKKELEGTAIALEQMGHSDIMPNLQDVYNINKSQVKKLGTYKDVKNAISRAKKEGPFYQALVEIAGIFTNQNFTAEELAKRILIKQDLTKEMRKAIQDKILKNSPEMITMVPDGTSVGGDATGIANTKLGMWYDKKGKSKFAETGSRKGLAIQQKRGLNTETFLTPFGLAVKGQRVTDRSVDGALREWVMQIATLSMNQAGRLADPKNIPLLKTKEGKNPFQFSTSQVNNIVQINSTFEVEYNGKDKLLAFYNLPKTLKINDEEDIDKFISMLKKDVFPLLPKEAFFGPSGGTSLTSSAKNLGMSSSNPLWKEFVKRVKALKNDTNIKFGDPIQGVDANTIYSLRNKYSKLFKSPSVIEANIKNGEIAKFNKEVAAVHKAMWRRIKDAINLDKNAATGIATYLGFVANDTGHWHKLGAQFAGYSKNITGRRYEYEHAMPATAAYLYLLDAALTDGVDFDSAYELVVDNYKLIALDKAMDDKLRNARTERGYSLQRRMPDNWDLLKDRWLDRYFNDIVFAQDGGINPNSIIALNGKTFTEEYGISFSKVPEFVNFDKNNIIQKAIAFSKSTRNETRGITVLDFDDTLATTRSLVRYTGPNGETGTLNAEQYASTYQDLLEQGYTFDFSEFNKVVGGKIAPLFQKALKLQGKFGPKNMFVLTARPPAAQQAIFDFLKANGLNIPLENITGLGNSTSEAKALWIADKVADGYNDFYFADDALQNVQAVKNMLDQFDVKSKVQQAKLQFSKGLSDGINDIIEQNTGIAAEKRFSSAEGRARGIGKGKYKVWIPPGAEDFMGLMYTLASAKGKKGEAQLQFIRKSLLEPYNNGISALNEAKQELSGNYKALLKQHPDIKKLLGKEVPDTSFTYDTAVRVYLWDKAGFEIPGLAESTKKKLLDAVNDFSELKNFSESLGKITKVKEGYPFPDGDWVAETIISDLAKATDEIGRQQFLQEFIDNANEMFNEENLNKIEAIYGRDYRDALENMLYRMKTGRNKNIGTTDAQLNRWTNWIRNSVGAIMFVNTRSAVLQTISSINFINWSDNNPIAAAAAFANQKQYWKDFTFIFNSDFLKQRRSGLRQDVNEARLANALVGKKNKAKAALAYLLKMGFLPTQIADSFAIAAGGATFYRNRIKSLMKDGMSQQEAEKQAFQDLQEVSNISQQSSDAALTSRQQNSILGAFILAFQNTPMQYARLTKKAAIDLIKRRGDWKSNVSKIVYYTAIQNLIFNAMQQALFALLFSDDDDDDEAELQRQIRLGNGMLDSVLRGTGIYGAVAATAKNIALEFYKQDLKGSRADHAYTILQFANISPPIGSKLRKLYSATQTRKFNRKAMEQMGYDIYNPVVPAVATAIEAFTNLPTGRIYKKFNNVSEAMNEENENWQRIALMMGWNTWDLGIKESFKVEYGRTRKNKSRSRLGGTKRRSRLAK